MKNICKKIMAIIVIMSVMCMKVGTFSYAVNVVQKNSSTTSSKNVVSESKKDEEGLASLKVGELALEPEFNTKTYEYTVNYIGEDTKLTIDAEGTKPYYAIEIIGNEKLEEGENLITILVSDQEGENIATYQLNVNKKLVDEEEVARQEKEEKMQKLMGKIAGVLAVGIIFVLIMIGIAKIKNNRKYDENYFEDEDEKEVPKALRKNQKEKGRRYK